MLELNEDLKNKYVEEREKAEKSLKEFSHSLQNIHNQYQSKFLIEQY